MSFSTSRFDIVDAFSFSFNALSAENNLHRAGRSGDCIWLNGVLDKKLPLFTRFDEVEEEANNYDNLINKRNRLGCTALWLAASMGHEDAVKLLLQRKADLEIYDVKGQTPLFVAVKFNRINTVKLLLKFGANPDGSHINSSTPVHLAARENFQQVLSILLKYGGDVNGRQSNKISLNNKCYNGTTPLYISVVYRHYECFKLLLNYGATLKSYLPTSNKQSNLPLLSAIVKYSCNISFAKLFVLHGGHLNISQNEFLQFTKHNSLDEEYQECISYLLNASVNPLTLKQLARIKVRTLISHKHLDIINQMHLAELIKRYLLFSVGEV